MDELDRNRKRKISMRGRSPAGAASPYELFRQEPQPPSEGETFIRAPRVEAAVRDGKRGRKNRNERSNEISTLP